MALLWCAALNQWNGSMWLGVWRFPDVGDLAAIATGPRLLMRSASFFCFNHFPLSFSLSFSLSLSLFKFLFLFFFCSECANSGNVWFVAFAPVSRVVQSGRCHPMRENGAAVVINRRWSGHSSRSSRSSHSHLKMIGCHSRWTCCNWNTTRWVSQSKWSNKTRWNIQMISGWARFFFWVGAFSHVPLVLVPFGAFRFIWSISFRFRFVYRHYFIHLCLRPGCPANAASMTANWICFFFSSFDPRWFHEPEFSVKSKSFDRPIVESVDWMAAPTSRAALRRVGRIVGFRRENMMERLWRVNRASTMLLQQLPKSHVHKRKERDKEKEKKEKKKKKKKKRRRSRRSRRKREPRWGKSEEGKEEVID